MVGQAARSQKRDAPMMIQWLTEFEPITCVPPSVLGAMLFGLGVMLLLFGWQVYRISLVVLGVLVGGAIGGGLAFLVKLPMIILALPIGILVGLLAGRLEKVGAFLVGGLCSALWILSSPAPVTDRIGLYVAAGLAFIVTGLLAVMLWRPMVIVSMAVTGSWLLVSALVTGTEPFSPGTLRQMASRRPMWTAIVMALVTLTGIGFQARSSAQEPAAAEKGKE